ncbi:hypothetical protein M430DRAFT_103043, partial [Amorphotheca resinae ATCC 22711]
KLYLYLVVFKDINKTTIILERSFINKVLENLVNNIYIIYLNNILIYSINKEEYI